MSTKSNSSLQWKYKYFGFWMNFLRLSVLECFILFIFLWFRTFHYIHLSFRLLSIYFFFVHRLPPLPISILIFPLRYLLQSTFSVFFILSFSSWFFILSSLPHTTMYVRMIFLPRFLIYREYWNPDRHTHYTHTEQIIVEY